MANPATTIIPILTITSMMGKHHTTRMTKPKQKKAVAGTLFFFFAAKTKNIHKKRPSSDNPFAIFSYDPLNTKPIELPPKKKKTKTSPKTPKTSTETPLESDNPFAKYAYQPSHK